MRFFLVFALLLLLAACQTQVSAVPTATRGLSTPIVNEDDLTSQDEFEGYYAYGFETSAFVPCGVKEQWWVTPANGEIGQALVNGYQELTGSQNRAVYARVRGTITPKGSYGHLGMFQRGITVNEIVVLRAGQDGDCK